MILKKKNVLVTGAGKGIGFSTFQELYNEGAFIYALVKNKKDREKFSNFNKDRFFVYFGNVKNLKLLNKIFLDSVKKKKKINSLVNNAGIRFRKKFLKIKSQELQNVFETNFFSVFKISQIFIRFLEKNKMSGSIVNISSIVGNIGFNELSGYSATKGAINALTKSLANEFANKNIRVNSVSPGFTKTSYFDHFKKNKKKLYNWTLSRIPLHRWGNSEEISKLICFLLSDKSSYITGENINIDGGWSSS